MTQHSRVLARAYGLTDEGLIDLPQKGSNVRIARVLHTRDRGGCPFCFAHGIESTNSTYHKNRRSWKHHRRKQYRRRRAM